MIIRWSRVEELREVSLDNAGICGKVQQIGRMVNYSVWQRDRDRKMVDEETNHGRKAGGELGRTTYKRLKVMISNLQSFI